MRLLSVVFVLLTIYNSNEVSSELNETETVNNEELIFLQSIEEETDGRYHMITEYIANLFCIDNSYRFNHIYVERSLSTGLADVLINRINKCMTAGILISR